MIPVSRTVLVMNTEYTYPVLSRSFCGLILKTSTKICFTGLTVLQNLSVVPEMNTLRRQISLPCIYS
jgi:hypothetical protein